MSKFSDNIENNKVIVLHSGGLDSTVCLLLALEKGLNPISLGIDYNQSNLIENHYASLQCRLLKIERKIIKITWNKATKNIPVGRTVDIIKNDSSEAFLEGRNILFLSIACAESAGLDAKEVWLGVNSIDFSGYPDCRPEFIRSFEKMLSLGFPNGPKIVTPLLEISKPEIARLAIRFGLNKHDTWSCYLPKITNKGVEPCNICDACVLNSYAWEGLTNSNDSLLNFNL